MSRIDGLKFISGDQVSNFEEDRGTKTMLYWRTGNTRKHIFDDGGTGEQGDRYPLDGPPHSQGDFSPF